MMHTFFKDWTGTRFGRVMIAWPVGKVRNRPRWLVFCDCGNFFTVSAANLSGGRTRSCGCARIETLAQRNYRHGKTLTAAYRVWGNMISRCADLSNKDYGGRGIKVCKRWRKSFKLFLKDMRLRPPGMTGKRATYSIDRVNVNGNYTPSNCRWATMRQQLKNRRSK